MPQSGPWNGPFALYSVPFQGPRRTYEQGVGSIENLILGVLIECECVDLVEFNT
jgi:hypothetical protein